MFICVLFYNYANSSDYIALNNSDQLLIAWDMEGSGHDLFKIVRQNLLGATEENHENTIDSLPLDQDSNPRPPNYESRALDWCK